MYERVEMHLKRGSVVRERANFLLFSLGKSISLFGSAIYTFAIGLYLLKTTGSGLTFATNIVLYTLPMVIINPIAGVIADKVNKKIVVVGADLLNGIFLLMIYLIATKIGLSIPLVYISTFFMTLLATFFNIGIEASKPNLVSNKKLADINSLDRVIESGSYIIGPMLGGLIYVLLDMKIFILVNALSFIIASFMEYFIDYEYNMNKESDKLEKNGKGSQMGLKENIFKEIREGYQYIFAREHMKALVYIFIALNFFFNFTIIIPLPYLLNTYWSIDPFVYGMVQAGLPVGMIIGALLVKKIMVRITYSRLLKGINYAASIGAVAFGIPILFSKFIFNSTFILTYYGLLMLISGVVVSWVDIPLSIILQQIVPKEILGRVISVKLSLVKIVVPLVLIISGYLLKFVSPLFIFLTGAIIFILFNRWFFGSPLGKRFIEVSDII